MSLSQCTGYTSGVVDGRVTDAKDYLKMCLHAFGVMIQYRDDPLTKDLPDSIPMDTYHVSRIEDRKRKLEEVKARTDDEWKEELNQFLKGEAVIAERSMIKAELFRGGTKRFSANASGDELKGWAEQYLQ